MFCISGRGYKNHESDRRFNDENVLDHAVIDADDQGERIVHEFRADSEPCTARISPASTFILATSLSLYRVIPHIETAPSLPKILAALRPGYMLEVWRLDRLSRWLDHLSEVATVLRERGEPHSSSIVETRRRSDGLTSTGNAKSRFINRGRGKQAAAGM